MLGELAVGDAEDVDADDRLRAPARVASVDHRVITLRDNETGLVLEIIGQRGHEAGKPGSAVGGPGVVLEVGVAPVALEDAGVSG